jgi:hypothetical protein
MSVSFFPARGDQPPRLRRAELQHLDINVANSNACDLLEAMGLPREDYVGGELSIDRFINRCRNRLRAGIGKRSPDLETIIMKEPGKATFYDCGRREGYIEEKLLTLVKMAEEGKTLGATLIAWS